MLLMDYSTFNWRHSRNIQILLKTSFVFSVINNLVNTCYVPGTIMGMKDIAGNKKSKSPWFLRDTIYFGEMG